MAKMLTASDLEALDRLEQKVRVLVNEIGRLKSEQASHVQENKRLRGELDTALARLADADGARAEMAAMQQERDQIRSRVADILGHLEGLDI